MDWQGQEDSKCARLNLSNDSPPQAYLSLFYVILNNLLDVLQSELGLLRPSDAFCKCNPPSRLELKHAHQAL